MAATRFLIDIPHPHFVHFFRNVIEQLGRENVLLTCQRSGIITDLLDRAKFDYFVLGKKYRGMLAKALGQFRYLLKYVRLIRRHDVRCLLGMSPALALAARITGRKMIFFDDDDSAVQPITRRLTVPLSHLIVTPGCLSFENYSSKHRMYAGYQELAYLAPAYFQPDETVVRRYGLEPGRYFIIRWNEFRAHHDSAEGGIPKEAKRELVARMSMNGRVLITSEYELEAEYAGFRLQIDPLDIHHVLAFARMFIGDSQTMTAEAAVLGTPAIRCNSFKGRIAYLKELEERYGLTYAFLPDEMDALMAKVSSLLEQDDLKEVWRGRRDAMLARVEDVNQFILELLRRETTGL